MMSECTGYSDDGEYPAQCPKCKGWLKWVDGDDGEQQPICNKCHAPLVIIPDEDSTENDQWGRICVLKPLPDDKPIVQETTGKEDQ
jgi:hypothetical protein